MQHTKLVSKKKNTSPKRSCCPYLHGPEIIHIQYWGHSQIQALKSSPDLSSCFPCATHLAWQDQGRERGTQKAPILPLTHTQDQPPQPCSSARADRYSDLSWAEFTEHSSAWHCPLSGFILLSALSGTSQSCREFPLAAAGEKFLLPTPWGARAKLAEFHSWKKKQPLEQMAGSKEWCWKQSFKAI